MAAAARALFYARKDAYDSAISTRLAALTTSLRIGGAATQYAREIQDLRTRMERVESCEIFLHDMLEATADFIVKRAIRCLL